MWEGASIYAGVGYYYAEGGSYLCWRGLVFMLEWASIHSEGGLVFTLEGASTDFELGVLFFLF